MFSPARRDTSVIAIAVVALSLALASCDDTETTGPGNPTSQFSREISFEEFRDILAGGGLFRVEIEVEIEALPDGSSLFVAREVEIEDAEEVVEEEEIESRIIDLVDLELSATDCEGKLRLALEPVEVEFSAALTEFEGDAEGDLACAEFVAQVQAELNAGRQPPVEAERPPLVSDGTLFAQAPGDPVFAARELELEDEGDEEIEINIDANNLILCPDPPLGCLGVLHVLDVMIVIDGATEIETELEEELDLAGEVDFESVVASVHIDSEHPSRGSVTLVDGRIVRVVEGTEIDDGSGKDERLSSLAEVDRALKDGKIVEAEGEGIVEDSGSITIIAIEVEFEVED